MKTLSKKLLSALVLSGALVISGSSFATGTYPMEAKLKQCETAFMKSHSGEMSQAEAAKAHREHRTLVLEILENLNKRNTEVSTQTGEVLSGDEILNNFRVMGRLLEMLADSHQTPQTTWNYAY